MLLLSPVLAVVSVFAPITCTYLGISHKVYTVINGCWRPWDQLHCFVDLCKLWEFMLVFCSCIIQLLCAEDECTRPGDVAHSMHCTCWVIDLRDGAMHSWH